MHQNRGLDVDSRSALARAQRRARFDGKCILYVDDERSLRMSVSRLLLREGAVCLGADTHDLAVVLLACEPLVELAILDFQMPDGDVGGLVPRLRGQRPDLTLIGTSGSDRRSEFAARGVERFLAKPWTLDDLLAVAPWPEAPVGREPVAGA
jgi:CheY-like chemotaxis protein